MFDSKQSLPIEIVAFLRMKKKNDDIKTFIINNSDKDKLTQLQLIIPKPMLLKI